MLLGIQVTPRGVTGGHVHVAIVLGGFRFCIINEHYKESYQYDSETFRRIPELFPPEINSTTIYDIFSTDVNYLLEVQKLKKKFITNPNATFYAIGYFIDVGTKYNPILEYIYIFDFHDIFINSYLNLVSFAMYNPYLGLFSDAFTPTMSTPPNKIITDNMLTGGHKTPDYWTQTLLSPVASISYSGGSSINYHAGAQSCMFDYSSYCSVLIPINAFCRNTDNGLLFSVSLKHFKIKKNICCLAECFGIVE
jgi:hypothetical protein